MEQQDALNYDVPDLVFQSAGEQQKAFIFASAYSDERVEIKERCLGQSGPITSANRTGATH